MKKRILDCLLVIILIAFTFSCKNEPKQNNTETTISLEGLTLNNNKKWTANKETHVGMKKIDSILKNNSFSDNKLLGEALSKETSYIIKSCNMTGEAHDQLHIVLVPILEEITEIKDISNTDELKSKTTNLKRLVSAYFKFFKN
jgi:hypothetical protein